MEWYEVVGFIVVWLLGLFLRGKINEFRRDYNKNDSWKSKI
jgi:hypothetical protein